MTDGDSHSVEFYWSQRGRRDEFYVPPVIIPAFRKRYVPYYIFFRSPSYDVSSDTTSSSHAGRRRCLCKPSLCLCLGLAFVLVLVAAITAAVVLQLSRNNNDNDLVTDTYEVQLQLANQRYTNKLANVTTDEFKRRQEKFCSLAIEKFDGVVKSCTVDSFSDHDGLEVRATLVYYRDRLRKLASKRGGVVGENATIAVMTSVLSTVDDDVTVGYIRREPELMSYRIETTMTLPTDERSEKKYCEALDIVYVMAVTYCNVTSHDADRIVATIRIKTPVLKRLAHDEGFPSDQVGVQSFLRQKLMNNDADFFKSHHFTNDPTVVDEFSSTTASTTTTTISPSTTSADETGSGDDGGEVVIA